MEKNEKSQQKDTNQHLISIVSKLLCFIEQADSEKERVEPHDNRN